MLEATFVRRRCSRDRVYVTRGDGTSTGWDFPSYGDGLPHDLCHLVVEDALKLSDGFWGLVDRHAEVGVVNNQATLMRDGMPLVEHPGIDFCGLIQAEHAVAVMCSPAIDVDQIGRVAVARPGPPSLSAVPVGEIAERLGFDLPESATSTAVATIHGRLRELERRWRGLDDGGSITLVFAGGDS